MSFELLHGASWMDQAGCIYPIKGFHENWLRANPELAEGCQNVSELVLKKQWISISLFSDGYLELLVPSMEDSALRGRLGTLLGRNRDKWKKALIISMDAEGYSIFGPEAVDDNLQLDSSLFIHI